MQDTAVVHRPMEAEVEAIAAVTEVAAMEIHLDLEDSLPGGRCHHLTPWRLFSKQSRGRQSCTTWRLAAVLDHITMISTFLATALRSPILHEASSVLAYFLLTLRHAGLGAAKPCQRPPWSDVAAVHQHVS